MRSATIGLFVITIASNIAASLILKKISSTTVSSFPSWGAIPWLAGALFFYGAAFVFYAAILREVPVSKAYTLITFGAQVGLIVAGGVIYDEQFGILAWVGLGFVLTGLLMVAASAAS